MTIRVRSVFTIACAIPLLLQAPFSPVPDFNFANVTPERARGRRQDAVTIRVRSVFTIACAIPLLLQAPFSPVPDFNFANVRLK